MDVGTKYSTSHTSECLGEGLEWATALVCVREQAGWVLVIHPHALLGRITAHYCHYYGSHTSKIAAERGVAYISSVTATHREEMFGCDVTIMDNGYELIKPPARTSPRGNP